MDAGGGDDLEIPVSQYMSDWQSAPHVLLDVREQEEWDAGHAAAARLIPLGDLDARLGELDPMRPIAVICRSGRRSLMAAEYLKDRGFANPVSVAGGMIAWQEAGHPVVL
ncbi:MAG: rhodanese-like domain-containing protein [Chloroflexota bacterium]